MRSLLVHHKDLLLAGVAEVDALARENRRLQELLGRTTELLARLASSSPDV